LISYKDSLKIKKGISFTILVNSIDITLKKKIINIEFLNKQNILNLLEEFKCKKKVSSISNYHIKDISISNTEGLNFLKTSVKNNSVDLVLTDPPYLISKKTGFDDLLKKKTSLKDSYSKKYAFQTIFE
jgi:DNA modification methylase